MGKAGIAIGLVKCILPVFQFRFNCDEYVCVGHGDNVGPTASVVEFTTALQFTPRRLVRFKQIDKIIHQMPFRFKGHN